MMTFASSAAVSAGASWAQSGALVIAVAAINDIFKKRFIVVPSPEQKFVRGPRNIALDQFVQTNIIFTRL
jgi:cephalosporin-C deacetylase-like acetyl esterase